MFLWNLILPHIPSQEIGLGYFEHGLEFGQRLSIHGRQMAIGEPAEQQIPLPSPAVPAPEGEPFAPLGRRVVVDVDTPNTMNHSPEPRWYGVWCPADA